MKREAKKKIEPVKSSQKLVMPFKQGSKEINKPDFIPYACHFSPNTVLTKNGELLQVIRISGDTDMFSNMSAAKATIMDQQFRTILRQSINHAINSDHYAIWIHTLRRPTSRSAARVVSKEKNTINIVTDSVEEYVNDLYITVLVEGQTFNLYDVSAFFRQLYYPSEFKYRMKYLENAERELSAVTKTMLEHLEPYGAEQIGIVKQDGYFFSEIAKFLGKIINLREEEWQVTPQDLSEILPSHKLSFGSNVLELRGETGRHFGAIFTIKEYVEIHEQNLDELLRLPMEFIITESYDPLQTNKYHEEYKKISEIQALNELVPSTNIKDISRIPGRSNGGHLLGEHQISIMILADNLKELETNASSYVGKIQEIGLPIIREDIYMEDCYWAQLPGNFEFLKRLTPVETSRVGGFAALHNLARGAISSLRTASLQTRAGVEFPYKLHPDNGAHVLIAGPPHSGKTTFMNYLLGIQDTAIPRVICLDRNRSSEIFLRSMDAPYYHVMPENSLNTTAPALNPLLLEDTESNRIFLKMWVAELMMSHYSQLPDLQKQKIDSLIELNYKSPKSERLISKLVPQIWLDWERDTYTESLLKWCQIGYYRAVFEHNTDIFEEKIGHHLGLDLTSTHTDHFLHGPMMFYLMHRISENLDVTPTVLVLENGLNLLNTPSLIPHISNWLASLAKQNTIAVITAETSPHNAHPLLAQVNVMCRDRFYMAGTRFNFHTANSLEINTQHITMLESLSSSDREIMLMQAGEGTVLHLHLSQNAMEYVMLSSTHRALNIMSDAIRQTGQYANLWIPILEKNL